MLVCVCVCVCVCLILSSGCVLAPVWGVVGGWSGLHQRILPLHELLEQHTLQLETSSTGKEGKRKGGREEEGEGVRSKVGREG